ncbi:MAG: T9SS C-terminal target domain-containing protein [Calditrichaeota bacterium]|nr:MAG: T9SS C-terminal target domain-containing protein [Calditrichota bacterium]
MKLKIKIFYLILYLCSTAFSEEPSFVAIQFIDSQHGWLLSKAGEVFIARNHGLVWERISKLPVDTRKMGFVSAKIGFIIGSQSVFKTMDGGLSWKSILDEFPYVCSEAWFQNLSLTAEQIWLVYNTHCIITPYTLTGVLYVNDIKSDSLSFKNWALIQEGGLYDMTTLPEGKNWVVGSFYPSYGDTLTNGHHGAIYFNDLNEGNNWVIQYVDTLLDRNLNSVAFVDSSHGWVCGNRGLILHTKDGGVHWQEQSSGTVIDLTAVHFQNEKIGWIVGKEGVILNTLDGGKTWSTQNSGTSENLLDITAISVDTAWSVGSHRTLLHTFDGGNTWSPSLITGVKNHQIPVIEVLHPNYPNPFNPETTIEYELARAGHVRLTIYNLRGQIVRRLVNGNQLAGKQKVKWDGTTDQGVPVASGVYMMKLQVGKKSMWRKMILLR